MLSTAVSVWIRLWSQIPPSSSRPKSPYAAGVHRASFAVSDHPLYPHRLAWIADSVEKPKRCWGPHGFNYGLTAPPYPPRLAWIADSGRKAHVFWGSTRLQLRSQTWTEILAKASSPFCPASASSAKASPPFFLVCRLRPKCPCAAGVGTHPPRLSWFADSGHSAHVLLGGVTDSATRGHVPDYGHSAHVLDSSLGRHAPPVVMPLLSSASASTPLTST